jgi:hypothetical protein
MFSDKPSIKYLYLFGSKCYVHIPEEKQIRTSKLSPRGLKYYVVGYTESSKILWLYNPQKYRVFRSKDVVFSESTIRLESITIKSQANLPLDLDDDAPWTIELKWDSWEWIMTNLDDAIDQAENGNPTLRKLIALHLHEANSNIGLSDKDQELLDKLKLLDFMEKKKSKSPTPPPHPSGSSMNKKKSALEIPPVNIDWSLYQDFS